MYTNEIDELLAMVEVAEATALSVTKAYGMNPETYEPVPMWHEVEVDDGLEAMWRELYEMEMAR